MADPLAPLPDDPPSQLHLAGLAANQAATAGRFADYHSRRSPQTLRRQTADLALFARYLQEVGVATGDFMQDPQAWSGVTWGLVEGFLRWQLLNSYAVSSINVRLSTLKTYCKLAFQSGVLDVQTWTQIRAIEGYAHRETARIDASRAEKEIATRVGSKKADPVSLTAEQISALKSQPDTPQGRRDALLLCLLLDHGLRVGELVLLQVEHFDLARGELRFYRPKVDRQQLHRLTADTLKAARRYLAQDAPASGIIWRGSRKGDAGLQGQGLSTRAITARVRALGEALGIQTLSAHDCRHAWATRAARAGTPLERLQDAGGWASLAMPARYIDAAEAANDGVDLD